MSFKTLSITSRLVGASENVTLACALKDLNSAAGKTQAEQKATIPIPCSRLLHFEDFMKILL